MKLKQLLTKPLAMTALISALAAPAATVQVTTDVTANTTWYATNTYLLQTVVYVRNNAILTIQPGTVIKGSTNATTLISRTGIPNLISALWVTRGSRLEAVGTVTRPIIFTYEGDDLANPNDVPFNLTGQWGGVVLCGRARLNTVSYLPGQSGNPIFELFEGTEAEGPNGEHLFGGSDDNDNSGTLRYVSIRYPGNTFAPAREMNGLTMGAVGKGTSIEYVEVLNSSDDAFEWWGGCVDTRYLVAAFCEDDDFDTDQGYRGNNQFWFGIKPPWSGSSDSRGFETDGDLAQGVTGEQPKSQWTVHNATLIGRGKGATGFGGGIGWNARDEAAPNVINSILAEFAVGVLIDTDGVAEFTAGLADMRHTIVDAAVGPSGANANANVLFTDSARMNTVEAAGLGGISYTNNAGLNPRPQAGSPALGNVEAQPAELQATSYRGAFGPHDSWADCWTALSSLGFFHDGRHLVNVTADITTDTTWYATNTYMLQTVVYVRNNSVLTIEPGTVIKGSTNAATLISRTGIPNLISALWVTRGSRLEAAGTPDRPIVFTYEGDNVNALYDVPFNLTGQWGGVVLCGRARLNTVSYLPGQSGNPIYELFEGTEAEGPNGEHLFGGNDDNDNSGTLRYVSIRHPGNTFAPAREMNGLTMGAVGKGTTIEYVEVLNSSDDAFEWWGGCVDTRYLVAAFCEDDDFDTDQGYRGSNQFWFGIKPPWSGSSDSRALETDGDLAQGVTGEQPKSQWTVHNATLIGRGTGASGFGGGIGWNPRDEAAPNVINSIFTEFVAGVKVDTDGLAEFDAGLADLRHSIFHVVNGTSDANAAYLFTDESRMNTIEDPLIGGVSYTNLMCLDPRPLWGSPAFDLVLAQPAGFTPTTYRGAFDADDTWAHGWTALYKLKYLRGTLYPSVEPPCASPLLSIAPNGDDVDITFDTEIGCIYQLQSASQLDSPTSWSDDGAVIPGTGGPVTVSRSALGGPNFYQVVVE